MTTENNAAPSGLTEEKIAHIAAAHTNSVIEFDHMLKFARALLAAAPKAAEQTGQEAFAYAPLPEYAQMIDGDKPRTAMTVCREQGGAFQIALYAAPLPRASDAAAPTLQQISDYLHGLDALQREVIEREARALPPSSDHFAHDRKLAAQPDERAVFPFITIHEDMLRALEHVECVYRLNVVKDDEPSSTLDNLQRVIKRARATAPQAVCQSCNGHGMIGGPSYYAPDEGGEPCPDCAPQATKGDERATLIAENHAVMRWQGDGRTEEEFGAFRAGYKAGRVGSDRATSPQAEQRMNDAEEPRFVNLEGLRTKLLAPRVIVRDEDGYLTHPDFPICDEGTHAGKFLDAFGIEAKFVAMESDDPAAADRYFEAGEAHCSYWMPTAPEGDGWLLLEIYETEDGPCALYGRDRYEAENAAKRKRTREQHDRIDAARKADSIAEIEREGGEA